MSALIQALERKTNGHAADDPMMSLPFLDVAAWEGRPIPTRQFAVEPELMPAANVSILSGHGGQGKSTLATHLCAAHTRALPWLNYLPEPGPAMMVCCEDDPDEIHRRLARIADHYGVSVSEFRDLKPLSLAGQDAVLGAPDKSGIIRPTPLFQRIRAEALEMRPKQIVLDNAADIYAGNENERGMVRQFITMLRGLAIETGASVLLTLHPSLTGINSGTGISGNTAWFNSVRAQLYLKPATTESGDEPDKDLRELEARKNNYGPLAETALLRWRDGVFVVERGKGGLDRLAAEQTANELFLKLLDRFNRQGRNVSPKRGPTYGPALFAKEADAKAAGVRGSAFEQAMSRLFAADAIHMEPYGPPSRGTSRLVSGASS